MSQKKRRTLPLSLSFFYDQYCENGKSNCRLFVGSLVGVGGFATLSNMYFTLIEQERGLPGPMREFDTRLDKFAYRRELCTCPSV